jgi:hypothetical protein
MAALTPDTTSELAGALGESPTALTKGFSAAAPALLAGALQRSSTPGGADNLLDLLTRTLSRGNPLDRTGAIAADPEARKTYMADGQGLASSLLGGNMGAVAGAVASAAGIGSTSASSLLALACAAGHGCAGTRRRAEAERLWPASPCSAASGAGILGALPSGLGSLFGLGAQAASAGQYATAAVARTGRRRPAASPGSFSGSSAPLSCWASFSPCAPAAHPRSSRRSRPCRRRPRRPSPSPPSR